MPIRPDTPHTTAHRIVTGHFRENKGYFAYRSHGTQDWLLIYTLGGMGRFGYPGDSATSPSATIDAQPGDILLLRPGTLHDYQTHPDAAEWDLLWAHFHPRPEWIAWLDWPLIDAHSRGLMRLTLSDESMRSRIEGALSEMHRRAVSSHRLRDSMAMNALEEAILWCDTLIPQAAHPVDPRIAEAEEYFCQHLKQTVNLDDVSSAVGLSVSRFSYLFHQQTGLTPQRYYERQRLERARQLLEVTTMPIKQVAHEVGFSNPFYFTQRFKSHTGKNPRAYRAAQTK